MLRRAPQRAREARVKVRQNLASTALAAGPARLQWASNDRIGALERRRAAPSVETPLKIGGLSLEPQSRRVTKDGAPITLTVREFELLHYLMSNPDRVVSRERLLNSVWDYGYDPGTKIVDVYVRYLRQKIDGPEGTPSLIQTVRGIGYMMSSDRTRA